jgi:hypothetical protein
MFFRLAQIPCLALTIAGCAGGADADDDDVGEADISEAQRMTSSYTSLETKDCAKTAGSGSLGAQGIPDFRCDGPGPYKLVQVQSITVHRIGLQIVEGERLTGLGFVERGDFGFYQVLGDKAEWRHAIGKPNEPHALIARVYAHDIEPDRTRQLLTISKLNGQRPCLFRVIDANRPEANEKARAWAERARKAAACPANVPLVHN